MRTRELLLVAVILAVVAAFVPGCAPPPKSAEAPAPSSVAPASPSPAPTSVGQPRAGGTLPRANYDDALNLDIHQGTATNVHSILANVYNGLLRFDPVDVNKVVLDLAEKWDVSPDGKAYTFRLREGVQWHDGKPFTSDDAKFNLERMAFWREHKIVSPRGGQSLSAVEKVEAPDVRSVRTILKYPSASFLANAASGWVLMLPKHVIQAKGDMKKDAVGTGAFRLKEWNLGVSTELVKNRDYFTKGLPYLDGIKFYPMKDAATRFAAFRTGQVKMTALGSMAMTHAQADVARKEMADKAAIVEYPSGMRYQFFMPVNKKPWDDIRVRRALDLAFDRKAAIAVNNNVGVLGAAMHPGGVWGMAQDEVMKLPGFRQPKDADVAQAKTLMSEAGYASGFKTRLLIRAAAATEAQGVVAKDQLAKLGIEATIDAQETTAFLDRLDRHDFELAQYTPSDALDDPDITISGYYVAGGSRNFGDFSDAQIDQLFKKQAPMLDEKERKKVVVEIQQRILDLAIYPIVFWDVYNIGFWKEVRGYAPGFGPYTQNNLDHVWLAK